MDPTLTEPFQAGRSAARILFDFAAMVACIKEHPTAPLLDFGAGTGWLSELVARLGYPVVAYDVHGDLERCVQARLKADNRIPHGAISVRQGHGLELPFSASTFSHVLCFDTLHHISDYAAIFREFARVLQTGGRAIFVEPGANHSKSPETVAFVREQKKHDPTWIERDVVLEEISSVAMAAGFRDFKLVPLPHPLAFTTYGVPQWTAFREGDKRLRALLTDQLAALNYYDRIVFYCE
jgi:SAM-dependent methyltransferase